MAAVAIAEGFGFEDAADFHGFLTVRCKRFAWVTSWLTLLSRRVRTLI
jgi:hypothetical protein